LNLPKKRKRSLNLEKDLALIQEDFRAMSNPKPHDPRDLESYLDFLDELWSSERQRVVNKKFYSEAFRL